MGVNLSQKTVAIIGGTGFVGRSITEKLARAGARIIILARNGERAKNLKPLGDIGQITAIAGNALDDDSLLSVIRPADMVINLIGILAPSRGQTFTALHSKLPARIAEIASQNGVEAIMHLSALGADLKSSSHYARTKAEGERNLLRQFDQATILRPSVIFGPGDNFFNRFGQLAMVAPALPLIGGGRNLMQPVYVGDVSDAIVKALASPEVKGSIYQLCGPKTYSFAELMTYILQVTNRRCMLVPVPFWVMVLPAIMAGLLPGSPLTLDQLALLKTDNISQKSIPDLAKLGISPTAIEAVVPDYLASFRPGGRFI